MYHTSQIQKYVCTTCKQYTRDQIQVEMAICINEDYPVQGIDIDFAADNNSLMFFPKFFNCGTISEDNLTGQFAVPSTEDTVKAIVAVDPEPLGITFVALIRTKLLRKARDMLIHTKSIIQGASSAIVVTERPHDRILQGGDVRPVDAGSMSSIRFR